MITGVVCFKYVSIIPSIVPGIRHWPYYWWNIDFIKLWHILYMQANLLIMGMLQPKHWLNNICRKRNLKTMFPSPDTLQGLKKGVQGKDCVLAEQCLTVQGPFWVCWWSFVHKMNLQWQNYTLSTSQFPHTINYLENPHSKLNKLWEMFLIAASDITSCSVRTGILNTSCCSQSWDYFSTNRIIIPHKNHFIQDWLNATLFCNGLWRKIWALWTLQCQWEWGSNIKVIIVTVL